MARLRWFWGTYWQKCLVYGCGVAATIGLLGYKLGSLTSGLASSETAMPTTHSLAHQLLQNPQYLPEQIIRLAISFSPYHGYTVSRLPSVLLGILLLILFVYVVRMWYGPRTAWFGAFLLVASPWYLHIARSATNDILYPLALLALLVYTIEVQEPHKRWFFLLTPVLFSLIIYIPGMVWLLLLSVLWYRGDFKAMWESASYALRTQWLLLWPVCLSLLGYALWHKPKLALDFAGLPQAVPHPLIALQHFGALWVHIFARGPQNPTVGLGNLPLLNVFATAMFVVGAYFYIVHWRSNRSKLLLAITTVSTLLIAVGNKVQPSILLPIIYAIVAGGLGYLIHDWFKTFPRNPFARALGYILVTAVLVFSTIYNLRQYFVAWPHAEATKTTFVHRI